MNLAVALILFSISASTFASETVRFNLGADLNKCLNTGTEVSCSVIKVLSDQPVTIELKEANGAPVLHGSYNFKFSNENYAFTGRVEIRKRGVGNSNRPKYLLTIGWIYLKPGDSNSLKTQPLGYVELDDFSELSNVSWAAPVVEEGFLSLAPWVRLAPLPQ